MIRQSTLLKKFQRLKDFNVNLDNVQTNIVVFSYNKKSKSDFIQLMEKNGVRISSGSYENLRSVFHMDVSMEEVKKSIEIIKNVL